jgi:ABC-type microcin C transport system permease subunit YejE
MVEMVGFCQVMWIVMLKSTKDRVLGVDTTGQKVLSRVRYGTACLLIMDVVESVPCSVVWEIGVDTRLGSHGARGVMVPLLE